MAIPIILCGGGGTRLWPLSKPHHPKPFLRLLGKYSLFQQTLQCCRTFETPLIIGHVSHLALIQQQCHEIGIAPRGILLEPQSRGTAAAVSAASSFLKSTFENHPLLILPADLVIQDQIAFEADIHSAIAYSHDPKFIAFGITPTHPEPRFGYIEAGDELQKDVFAIQHFMEKSTSRKAIPTNPQKYFWNSGMCVTSLANLHHSLHQRQPELARLVTQSVRDATVTSLQSTFLLSLEEASFSAAPQMSFETAVQQDLSNGILLRAHFDWNDAGTWNALWELQASETKANVIHGKAQLRDSHGCYVHASTKRISVLGCEDLVIVETEDEILITTRQAAEKVGIFSE